MKKIIFLMFFVALFSGADALAADGDFIIDGNVGIGTSSPNGTFHVAKGNLRFVVGTTINEAILRRDDGIARLKILTNNPGSMAAIRLQNEPGSVGDFIIDDNGFFNLVANDQNLLSLWASGNNAVIDFNKQRVDADISFHGDTEDNLLYIDGGTGNVGIGTNSPSAKVDVGSSTGYDQLRLRNQYTPTGTSDSNGNTGDIAWDDSYVYVKTSAGWKRSHLSTW